MAAAPRRRRPAGLGGHAHRAATAWNPDRKGAVGITDRPQRRRAARGHATAAAAAPRRRGRAARVTLSASGAGRGAARLRGPPGVGGARRGEEALGRAFVQGQRRQRRDGRRGRRRALRSVRTAGAVILMTGQGPARLGARRATASVFELDPTRTLRGADLDPAAGPGGQCQRMRHHRRERRERQGERGEPKGEAAMTSSTGHREILGRGVSHGCRLAPGSAPSRSRARAHLRSQRLPCASVP